MSRSRRLLLATVCAVAVASVYGIQPVLPEAGKDLGLRPDALGWLVAAGQLGYLVGLVLLVPLGDRFDRRVLIPVHLGLVAVGCTAAAVAETGSGAVAGLVVAGLFAVVVQTTVAYVAAVSAPEERGRNIGAVTSGVVIGILGVRVVAGWLAELADWRAVYLGLAAVSLGLAVVTWFGVAPEAARRVPGFRRQFGELGRLVGTDRLFRTRGLIAFFLFASFGTLWTGLALPLSQAPWQLGTGQIGLFGLVGLAGAVGAARAGRWADRGWAAPVGVGALGLLVVSWLFIGQAAASLWLLALGIVVLDFAVQAVHVGNQHLLATAHPGHGSGLIGAYMAFYSLGSAAGAVTTTWVYDRAGWWGVSALGAGYALAGLAVAVWGYRIAGRVDGAARKRRVVGTRRSRSTTS